ncbi:inositol monophosphatase [Patescibacteria group bacterium AH-259-L05]|nr:inositol monophosphatase [Patescibacteria group bacterium AH-259-L05]
MKTTLIKALKIAGKISMKYFGKIDTVKTKENHSDIVTQADLEADKAIIKTITEHFPNHSIISEETGFINPGSDYIWLVDSIDGTSGYAAGTPYFGTIIGVLQNYQPVMAGMYLPFYHDLYFAERNKGAYCNGKKISVTAETNLKNVLVAHSLNFSKTKAHIQRDINIIKQVILNARAHRATNCLIDYCYTADGRFGAVIQQSNHIWEAPAHYLLIKEAGGIATEINGRPLNFYVDQSNYTKEFTIIGANKTLHSNLLKLIAKAYTTRYKLS